MNAAEMYTMLEKHYEAPPSRPPAGVMVKELQAPNSLRRGDALWLPVSPGHRGQIIGHEIKVSRSDLVTELRDPTKADTWLQYCHRWWLVISDEKFLEGLDIPPEWGVLVPPKRANTRFMHVVQKAPLLHPSPAGLQHAWGAIHARTTYASMNSVQNVEQLQRENARMLQTLSEQRQQITTLEQTIGKEDSTYMRSRATVSEILKQVNRLGGYGDETEKSMRGLEWGIDPERVARNILAEMAGERAREEIVRALAIIGDNVKNARELISAARKTIE